MVFIIRQVKTSHPIHLALPIFGLRNDFVLLLLKWAKFQRTYHVLMDAGSVFLREKKEGL